MQDCGLWESLICTREQRSCGRAHQCTHSRMRSISILHHIDLRAPWYSPPWTAWMACEWRQRALSLRILSGRMLSPSFSKCVCLLALGSCSCLGRTWVSRKQVAFLLWTDFLFLKNVYEMPPPVSNMKGNLSPLSSELREKSTECSFREAVWLGKWQEGLY